VQVDSGGARDELGELAEAFNRMARDLEKTTVSKEELEKLAGRLITAQEEERSRIARELHDDLTQRMAAVAIEAGNLAQSDPSGDWRAGVRTLREKIAKLADDIHGLSRSLHPAMLDDLGLAACVEAECRASFERGGPPVESSIEGEFEDLPAAVRLTLLRIVQEGLRNIQRHAAAEEVRLRLKRDSDGVLLTMSDDGRGFTRDDPQWRPGLGLASMEERARFAGGHFEVVSAPGQGTRLTVRIPQHGG
jgi:signal transduction histidine kinase